MDTILDQIKEVSKIVPELRLGQLLICAANKSGWVGDDIFNIENFQLSKGLLLLKDEIMLQKSKT